MPAVALSRRTEAAPERSEDFKGGAAPTFDHAALVDGIHDQLLKLRADPNPIARATADFLAHETARYIAFVGGVANRRGESFAQDATLARRDELICKLGKTMTARTLRDELLHYAGTNWRRDRGHPNPYPGHDRRHEFYNILRLRDHVPSERWLREI